MENHFEDTDNLHFPASKKGTFGIGSLIATALACSILGGVFGAFFGRQPPVSNVLAGRRERTRLELSAVDTSEVMTPAEVYAANVASTVGITTSVTTNFWGFPTTSAASGSGFIYTDTGYILTNYHVIDNSDTITVALYDGATYDARLVGYDEGSDIAVLKVEAQNLVPVVLGDSDNLNVGDPVLAIGNPLGELTFSLTAGTVSALDRTVTFSNGATMELLQTDCAINSGNSGGALFNLHGEVIGITNAKYSSGGGASIDNIGFAIPLNQVRNTVDSIIRQGYVSKPYIGIQVSTVSEQLSGYGLPQGAAVQSVAAGGPAEKAGLQPHDIITSVDSQNITVSSQLVNYIRSCQIGQVLTLSVYRQGQQLQITLTVAESPRSGTNPGQ